MEIRSEEPEEATDNVQEEPNNKREEEKTEAQVAQQGDTNRKSTKKKNVKKRSFKVEANRWEEMKREGKVDNCRLWLPLEVEGELMNGVHVRATRSRKVAGRIRVRATRPVVK